jgi:hypothetical protein
VAFSLFLGPIKTSIYKPQKASKSVFLGFFDSIVRCRREMKSEFQPGCNIAMKISPHEYDETVRFYAEVLGSSSNPAHAPAVVFEFAEYGVMRRDEIEKLPVDFEGLWITNAAGIIHLVSSDDAADNENL